MNGRALYQRRRSAPETTDSGGFFLTEQGFNKARNGAAALALALCALAVAEASPQEGDPEKELREVRERIEQLQRSVRHDADRRDALSGQLRKAEEQVRGARSRLGDVRKRQIGRAHV